MKADSIAEHLSVLDNHFKYLKSTRALLRRQLAAAGLARCRALLEAMILMRDRDREDVMGVLLRALYEAWVVSLYVFYKGTDLSCARVNRNILEELTREYRKGFAIKLST